MGTAVKARVFMSGRSQHVTIPAEYRFKTDEVYVERDPLSGALKLSEKPPRRPMAEIFAELDAAGAADFELERDLRPEASEAARTYGPSTGGLNSVGKSLSPLDMLIASHAISTGAVLVSHDREFQHLSPWLTIVD